MPKRCTWSNEHTNRGKLKISKWEGVRGGGYTGVPGTRVDGGARNKDDGCVKKDRSWGGGMLRGLFLKGAFRFLKKRKKAFGMHSAPIQS